MTTKPDRNRRVTYRAVALIAFIATMTASTRMRADVETVGNCGGASITIPFTDVASNNGFFCAIAEAYLSGLTNGTSATTYSPSQNVTREQMAAFITRTQDSALRRGSRRAALDQWWTTQSIPTTARTQVGGFPRFVKCDGDDLWVSNASNTVSRVRASDGKLLGTWTGATGASAILVARGRIYIAGFDGALYSIDPAQPPGPVTLVTNSLGNTFSIAYNGASIFTSDFQGSVSIVTFCQPVCVTTVTAGLINPLGILYDGASIWVADRGDHTLKKLAAGGGVALSIPVGNGPTYPVFDGTNIWVPNESNTVTVVRVKDAAGNPLSQPFVLATLSGNGLVGPVQAAFDGQRILVTNGLDSVSLWRATDLAPLGSFPLPDNSDPGGVCSDGINFWIVLSGLDQLARF